jgi:hypothetical protein
MGYPELIASQKPGWDILVCRLLISRVVSMGRRNTRLEPSSTENKSQNRPLG